MIIVLSSYCLAPSCWNQFVENEKGVLTMLFWSAAWTQENCVLNCSAPRASAFWRGRYIESSLVSTSASRSCSQNKSSKEKSSRSPLRATTLESNVKKSSRVEFHEPLVSFRWVLAQLATKEQYAKVRMKLVLICFLSSLPCTSSMWCWVFL